MHVEPGDHGLGRSHGGLTTKIQLAVEQAQRPMALVVTAGQRCDSPRFQVVLGRVKIPRLGPGRPCTRPDKVRADKAYGSHANRAYRRRRGIRCTIPEKRDQVPPPQARLARRATAEVRRGGLQGRPRRRVRDQSPQAPPRGRHPLRQTRHPLRGNRAGRGHRRVAVSHTLKTLPSSVEAGRAGQYALDRGGVFGAAPTCT
ncbi:transposase [Streptomyces sp. NPDC001255]|uniref:transposase n=1 Tax=Streptomyces sp. NPDC001255 TaxID=3364550 RepID=UPI003680C327